MAEVYANLIRRRRKTIEQVPEHLREFALKILLRKASWQSSMQPSL